mmetsp:Transcript_9216/g.19774  ORF Transcript_9216/g.19774 Transcript_9216/m.19774 type:complete len:82 (-) Transcript_9216:1163-1408(-)
MTVSMGSFTAGVGQKSCHLGQRSRDKRLVPACGFVGICTDADLSEPSEAPDVLGMHLEPSEELLDMDLFSRSLRPFAVRDS